MNPELRVVVDSNLLVSRLLLPESKATRVVSYIIRRGTLLFTTDSLAELAEVLQRPKFDPYVTQAERLKFLELLYRIGTEVIVTRRVQACRDPRDDKILEVAVNGNADAIVTGDKDLLALHPYLGVPILTATQFLETYVSAP